MTRFKLIIMSLVILFPYRGFGVHAQESDYAWEMGAHLGMAGYLGDYNGANPFRSPGFAVSVNGSYIYDVRWSFSANAGVSSLRGSTSNAVWEMPETTTAKFSAVAAELNFRAEFNFFPYGIGETYKSLKRYTPYLAAGVGMVMAKAKGASMGVAPEIPLVFGFKYKVNPKLNLKAELSFTKTFCDVVDGASDVYGIKSSWFHNTDWVTSLTVGVSFEFGERCPTCHYVD